MFNRTVSIIAALLIIYTCSAQTLVNNYENPIYTALPFLRLSADARMSGMGDAGVAAMHVNGIYSNAAGNVFRENASALSLNYKSTGSRFVSLSGYHKFKEKNVFSGGLRYNNLGNSTYATASGMQTVGSYEFSVDASYSRKLHERLSVGTTLKYFYSKISEGMIINGLEMSPVSGIAGDISCLYSNKDITLNSKPAEFSFGINISNLGNEVTYTSAIYALPIPSNLGIGIALKSQFNEMNNITFALDFNKLLVPTINYIDQSVFHGMVHSFNDAPGGFSEELKEITIAAGAEYVYNDLVFLRTGLFYENPDKGPRKYFTAGAGIKYRDVQLDVAYRFFNNTQAVVAEKVLSLSLSYLFGGVEN
ncbi:MAG: type IX secretion system outer membrane channel protein PorV [Chitinophagales bacterium]